MSIDNLSYTDLYNITIEHFTQLFHIGAQKALSHPMVKAAASFLIEMPITGDVPMPEDEQALVWLRQLFLLVSYMKAFHACKKVGK